MWREIKICLGLNEQTDLVAFCKSLFLLVITDDIFSSVHYPALFQENNRRSFLVSRRLFLRLSLEVSAKLSGSLIRCAIAMWFLNESRARPAHCRSLKRRRRLSLIDYRGSRIGCMHSGWNIYYYLTLISYLTREITWVIQPLRRSSRFSPVIAFDVLIIYLLSIYHSAISPSFRIISRDLSRIVER